MKKMSTSNADCSNGKGQCPDIIVNVKDVGPAKRHSECCIYKVSNKLREVKEEAYTPKLISIGPVHHKKKEQDNILSDNKKEQDRKKELENQEGLKLRYFKEFFDKTTCKGQKGFANIIEEREKEIRHCYAEEISLPKKEDFKEMILVDSVFIIELFLRTAAREGYEKDDYILSEPWLEEGIKRDLILLENQLPFFILDDLYRHISATKLDTAGLNFKKWEKKPLEEDRRLLDIQIKKPGPLEIIPCFNCSWLLHCLPCLKCFWCLKRMQTSLVIPPFVINHGTEHIFRNIMALEQCHYPKEAYICNYIVLLDFLINTRDDAELLVDKEIIVHSLGSNKEVAKMVNKLGKEIVEKNSCYLQLAKDLNEHYGNWWNKNIASLKTVYFRDIWRGTATFVGIIVLLVTIGNFLRPIVYHK